jgi:hypothetical protein
MAFSCRGAQAADPSAGSSVNAGDVWPALDPTETAAYREAQARDLEAARLQPIPVIAAN